MKIAPLAFTKPQVLSQHCISWMKWRGMVGGWGEL